MCGGLAQADPQRVCVCDRAAAGQDEMGIGPIKRMRKNEMVPGRPCLA